MFDAPTIAKSVTYRSVTVEIPISASVIEAKPRYESVPYPVL